MLFRRRKPEHAWARIRTFVWPRRSFRRSTQYYAKRVLRLTATPHSIAAGVASGVFVSFTPFLGIHFLFAAAIAWILRGNIVASAMGTMFGNPVTFPFMWGGSLELGRFILYGPHPAATETVELGHLLMNMELSELWGPILMPLTLGSVPLGLTFGLIFYGLTRWAAVTFREERRRRLAERARRRAAGQSYGPKAAIT